MIGVLILDVLATYNNLTIYTREDQEQSIREISTGEHIKLPLAIENFKCKKNEVLHVNFRRKYTHNRS